MTLAGSQRVLMASGNSRPGSGLPLSSGRRLPLWPVFLAMLSGCGTDAPGIGGLSESPRWTVEPTPTAVVGEAEGADPYLLSRVRTVRILPGGGLAIGDGGSGSIRVFDSTGAFTRALGRTGQGPGEFEYLSASWLMTPDTLRIYDSRALRLTTFLMDGTLLSTVTLRAEDGWPELYLGRFSDGSHAAAWIVQGPRGDGPVSPDRMRLARFETDGDPRDSLGSLDGMWRESRSPLPFSPHFAGTLVGDTVFFGNGADGVIYAVRPNGETLRSFRAPLPANNVAQAWSDLRARLDSAALARLGDVEDLPEANSIPLFSDLVSDRAGRVWVKRYDPGVDSHWLGRPRTGGEWWALSTAGEVLGRLDVPEGLRLMDITEQYLAGLTKDEMGVERVAVYRLRPGRGESLTPPN